MKFLDICLAPKKAGQDAFKSGHSVHYNPFRNTNGHAKEFDLWQEGYMTESQKKKAGQKPQ
jgi:hypothetical protein